MNTEELRSWLMIDNITLLEVETMKQVYREYLLRIKDFVNLSACCVMVHLDQSNVNKFIRGQDNAVSVESLQRLTNFIQTKFVA